MIEQGKLFEVVSKSPASTEPAHFAGHRTVTFTGEPGYDGIEEEDSIVEADREVPASSPEFDSHELLRSVIGYISSARKLEGLIASGPNSSPVVRLAEKRRTTPLTVLNDAQRRHTDSYNSARTDYENWLNVGAAVLTYLTSDTVQKPHFVQFKEQYYGGKVSDARRTKLLKNIK